MKQFGITLLLAGSVFGFLWLTNLLWFTLIVLAVVYAVANLYVAVRMLHNWGYFYGMEWLDRLDK